MSSSQNYGQGYTQGGSQQYSQQNTQSYAQSYSQPRTRAAQNASGPTSAATYPATHPATQPRPSYSYPRSLTPSLQQIPTGQAPMQYYTGRVQAFEQVPLGHPTSRKDMAAYVQTIMKPLEGGRR